MTVVEIPLIDTLIILLVNMNIIICKYEVNFWFYKTVSPNVIATLQRGILFTDPSPL